MAKQGFKGQWIEICRVGKATDSKGIEQNLDRKYLEDVIANYTQGNHEAPLVAGHPVSDSAPAFGWASELRLNGDVVEARFADTDDEFEKLVEAGRYKKRSASFYLDPPNLRHIGFLGAQPPAIKGLRNIQFADGDHITLENQFNLQETEMKDQDLDQLPESFWIKFKTKLGITDKKVDLSEAGNPLPQPTQFSEANVKEIVAEALKTAKAEITTEFTEKLEAKDTEIEALTKKVDGQIAGSVRSEIASFVESIPAEKGRHFLKRIHVADFLEALAVADAAAEKPGETISFSDGEGDDKQEFKSSLLDYAKQLILSRPNSVEFGEKFGNIVASKEADTMIDTDRVKSMKQAAGVATDGGEK